MIHCIAVLISVYFLSGTAAEVTVSAANLTQSGAWCWFGDPRAVHYLNKTYVGFIDTYGNISVATFDYVKKELQSISTLTHHFKKDDHNNPIVHIMPDEHILIFWSGHAGPKMFYRRSVRPLD